MVKMVAGMICIAASLYPVVADAGGAGAGNETCGAGSTGVPRGVDDGDRARLEAAVNDVLWHFDAGDYAGLAAEMSVTNGIGKDDVEIEAGDFTTTAQSMDVDSERRFLSMNLHAPVQGAKVVPGGRYATMSHLRACGGSPCEEQVVMRWIDGRWLLAGFYVYRQDHSTSGKTQ